jgi:hypothetical protein
VRDAYWGAAGRFRWTAAGAIDRDDPLYQSYKDTVRQYSSTHEIKLPDKLRAAEQVCKIMGWDAPTKSEAVTPPVPPPTPEELKDARETLARWVNFADASVVRKGQGNTKLYYPTHRG